MGIDRRQLLTGIGATGLLGACATQQSVSGAPSSSGSIWERISSDYDTEPGVINLEHGYWTQMSRPVLDRFTENTKRINAQHSHYARQHWTEDKAKVEARLAGYLNCKPSELALTRNASEALQALIGGYRPLQSGDAVLYADLDYPSVCRAFDTLARERGAQVVEVNIPEPTTFEGLVDFYDAALAANPNVRLMVLTHVSNKTGLVVPVREIISRARARNVDVIVDAAHTWGQMDFTVEDIDADFVAFNLHKWIGAPLGAGFVYIREGRLGDIGLNQSQSPDMEDKTEGRVYFGTMNFATVLTVMDALDYCDMVGWKAKANRFQELRDIWAEPARELNGVEILTPPDGRLYSGITSFRLSGQTSSEQNASIAKHLLDRYGIFTVHRTGVANGACIRVTPGLENQEEDCERLLKALKEIAA